MGKEKVFEAEDITFPPQSSIKLVKYAKGYGWEVKKISEDLFTALEEIDEIDSKMRKKYPSGE